jgi:hypothetical protein
MRRLLLLAVGASLLGGVLAADGEPARRTPLKTYCSPSGDLCYGIVRRSGAIYLELTTFEKYFSTYRLCVTPPGARERCRRYAVRRQGRLYGSIVRWRGNFPMTRAGVYRVAWKLRAPLGPALRIRLPRR